MSTEQASQKLSVISADNNELQLDFVEVDGIRIRYGIRRGTGTPMLLFNGIGANLDLCRPFVNALEGVEIIIFDMPGIGESEQMALPKRFRGLSKLSAKVLDALGYTGEIDVAGVSWGGALAQEFVHTFPKRVRKLVLAATSAGMLSLPGKPGVIYRLATPKRYISRTYMQDVAPHIYGGMIRRRPDLVQQYAGLTRRPSGRGYIYQLLAGMGWTSAHWLPRLKQPTLLMAGDDDPIIPVFNMRLLNYLIPNSRLHIVRNGGHLFMVWRAHESASIVRKFLNDELSAA